MNEAARLVAWIDSHYPPEPTRDNCDGTLTVACKCVNVYTRAVWIERKVIPATVRAAREWLEY